MRGDRKPSLASALGEARLRLEQLQGRKSSPSEQDTKAILIEPVLAALGWDLRNVDEVSREYRHKPQDNPVDYALFLLRSPCLFIEAKALGTDLQDRKWTSQTIAYAATAGVEWCLLTDGNEYRLYNAHAPVDVDEKLFRRIRISEASEGALTLETLGLLAKEKIGEKSLETLWKAQFVDRRVRATLEELLRSPDKSLVSLIRRRTQGLTKTAVEGSLKRADIRIEFPLVTPPPGGSRKPVTAKESPQPVAGSIADLINACLIKPPCEIEVTHKKVRMTAVIQADGSVVFDGQTYHSLSVAGGMARVKVSGPPKDGRPYYQTNGWTFWKYRDPRSGRLEVVDRLRRQFLEGPK
jgi:hypothetical protein